MRLGLLWFAWEPWGQMTQGTVPPQSAPWGTPPAVSTLSIHLHTQGCSQCQEEVIFPEVQWLSQD